jgi:hypothetical protein
VLALVLALQQQVFFGNLHSHTSYSDGSGTPEEAYTHARDVAHLDFLAITEHNHKAAEGSGEPDPGPVPVHIARDATLYVGPQPSGLIPTAARFNAQGNFVALYGQEFSSISKGNHVNVFEVGNVIDEAVVPNGDFKKLSTWLDTHLDSAGKPALIQFNHPSLLADDSVEYGRDDFGTVAEWKNKMGAHAGLIEILNGPALTNGTGLPPQERMEADYLSYLNLGFHLAPTGDQDNHFRTWGTITDARTGVVAVQLTRDAILEALRARHVYATEDKNLRIIANVDGHLMGDRTGDHPAVGIELAIDGTIADDDEPDATYRIEVYSDDAPGGGVAQVAESIPLASQGPFHVSGVSFSGPSQYVFLRVTQFGEHGTDHAWTAPVWFDGTQTAPATPTAALRLVSILPNPPGSDLENEAATIKNVGTSSVSMTGWTLRDLTGNTWTLDSVGTLSAGQSATIVRHGQAMSMNNTGTETIELVSPTHQAVDHIAYSGAGVGQVIAHP